MKTAHVEIAIAKAYNSRANLMVPNVCWGMGLHECDVLMLSKAGYCTEFEIKISMADLRNDAKKWHGHYDRQHRIKYLIFVMPVKFMDKAEEILSLIPERAGLTFISYDDNWPRLFHHRKPKADKAARKWSDAQRYQLARLGALRIWRLKEKLAA